LIISKPPGEQPPLNGDLHLDTAVTSPGIQPSNHLAAVETNPTTAAIPTRDSAKGTNPTAAETVVSDSPEGTNPMTAATATKGLTARAPCAAITPSIEAASAKAQLPNAVTATVDPPSNVAVTSVLRAASEESSQPADATIGDSILAAVEDFK